MGQLMESFEHIQGMIDFFNRNHSWIVPLALAGITIFMIYKIVIIVKFIVSIPSGIAKIIAFIFSKKGFITILVLSGIALIIYMKMR